MKNAEMYGIQIKPIKEDGKWRGTRAEKDIRYFNFNYDKENETTIDEKERRSIDLLKVAFSKSEKPSLSCSFGIDSIMCLYLARKALIELERDPSDLDVVWNDTLNEFPEVRKYAIHLTDLWNLRLKVYKPDKPLKKIIDENGGITSDYFTARKGDRRNGTPLSEKCCGTLKHKPMKKAIKENEWDLVINGLRADESTQRLRAGLRDGEYFYSVAEWKSYVVRPILWWKEEEIWEYVFKNEIPYNGLYDKNIIKNYKKGIDLVLFDYEPKLKEVGLDIDDLLNERIGTVNKKQALLLKKIGFNVFTPRTGCQMCPIPVKYGYLQFMRLHYPKAYNAMVHKLGYGKALIDMVPDDVKKEIKELTGIEMTVEEASEHLKDILEAKPCTFDSFD